MWGVRGCWVWGDGCEEVLRSVACCESAGDAESCGRR